MTADPAAAGGVVQRTRIAAYAWCEAEDALLLCRIAAGLPGSGRLDAAGRRPRLRRGPGRCGVLRELREETGLGGQVDGLLGISSGILEPDVTVSGHRLHIVGIVYRVTADEDEPHDEPDGSTDHAEWIPFERLDELPLVDLVTAARAWAGR